MIWWSTPTPASPPEAGKAITKRFFDEELDRRPGPREQGGGAFCATVAGVHPYVMLNYTARRRDVQRRSHTSLGHGLHSGAGREAGRCSISSTPLTVAETASVFAETLVFERLLAETGKRRAAA